MGFLPNGSHSFEGGVRGNEQLLWEKHIHTVMYNKTNAKLGNVLVTWPCGVWWECNGGENGGRLVGGNGRGDGVGDHTSMTIVPALTQRKAFQSRGGWGQCCPIGWPGRWLVTLHWQTLFGTVFVIKAPLFIYFSRPTGGGPLDLSPAVRCYDTDMDYWLMTLTETKVYTL